jgi:hypothetical protein
LLCPAVTAAGEYSGKLERVGWKTVTIASGANERLTLAVDKTNRVQAAPYIGKRVMVRVAEDDGKPRAVRFKPFTTNKK